MILRYYYTWTNTEIDEKIKTYKSEFIKFVVDIKKIIFFIAIPILIIFYIICHIKFLYYIICFTCHIFVYLFRVFVLKGFYNLPEYYLGDEFYKTWLFYIIYWFSKNLKREIDTGWLPNLYFFQKKNHNYV